MRWLALVLTFICLLICPARANVLMLYTGATNPTLSSGVVTGATASTANNLFVSGVDTPALTLTVSGGPSTGTYAIPIIIGDENGNTV